MKSKLFAIAAVMFAAVMFTSCAKLDKVLVKKEGNWTVVTMTWKQTVGGVVAADTSFSNWGTVNFKDDGTGTTTPNDTSMFGQPVTFTWTANEDGDQLTFISGTAPNQDTVVFEVQDMKSKSMTLFNTETETVMGVTSVTEQTMSLERAE